MKTYMVSNVATPSARLRFFRANNEHEALAMAEAKLGVSRIILEATLVEGRL